MGKYRNHIFLLLFMLSYPGAAQDLVFSQYEISPTLSNPALYNQSSHLELQLAYRQQVLEFGQNFNSPLLLMKYPIFNARGHHQGSFLLSFLRDNQLDVLRVTGLHLGYAHQVKLRRGRLSFGLQAGYFQKSLNLEDLSTRSQFDFLTGFDPGLPSNEPNGRFNAYFGNLSTGIYWELQDAYQRPRFFLGGAINNANQPDASFTDEVSRVPVNYQGMSGIRFYLRKKIYLEPNVRWINRLGFNYYFLGSWMAYDFSGREKIKDKRGTFRLGFWYQTNGALVNAFKWENDKYLGLISYDLGLGSQNQVWLGNGALEISFGVKFQRKARKYPTRDPVIYDLVSLKNKIENSSILPTFEKEIDPGERGLKVAPWRKNLLQDLEVAYSNRLGRFAIVYFDEFNFEIREDSKGQVAKQAQIYKLFPSDNQGFTVLAASRIYTPEEDIKNQLLADSLAQIVADYLVKEQGIPEVAIEIQSLNSKDIFNFLENRLNQKPKVLVLLRRQ